MEVNWFEAVQNLEIFISNQLKLFILHNQSVMEVYERMNQIFA